MTLTLTITNADRLDNDAPLHIALDEQGAVIGRSVRCDWTLPDPDHYISSRHCEVSFDDGGYVLTDVSTNGTMLNGAAGRMDKPRPIERGDRFKIGRYEIVALVSDVSLDADTALDADECSPDAAFAFPDPQAKDEAYSAGLTPPSPPPPLRPAAGLASATPPTPAPPAPVAKTAPAEPALIATFAAAVGLSPDQFKSTGADTLERAGLVLRHLIAGLVTLVEARARAKSEMGAERTALSFDGNNPIKFARKPEQALAQLLNPKERGFMDAGAAVDDAFADLQAHQLATLRAMQGALRATLDRFSPAAIKGRADTKGIMARIMPGAREAALWQAYEREFAGVARGSDEAFMDVFAKEFRQAYIDLAGKPD